LIIAASVAGATIIGYPYSSNDSVQRVSDNKLTNDEGRSLQGFQLPAARGYVRSLYNSSMGLVRENEITDKYWLWSDNYLASLVLSKSDPLVSENITATLRAYGSSYGIHYASSWGALSQDNAGNISFNGSSETQIVDKVWLTSYDGATQLKCQDYADIAFLKSIYLYKSHHLDESKRCYHLGVAMFNGIGFKDKAYDSDGSRYCTYKVALWRIANKVTSFGNDDSTADKILTLMQDPISGGIYTHYTSDFSHQSHTNVETTAISILALET
jgi:hypothetical protein